MVFWGFVFLGFKVIVVCFWCVWHSSRSVKNACFFPSFGGFCGVASSCLFLGLEGLGVFVFLVFVFVVCVAFVSVLFALFLFCCWIVFGVGSCFAFVFVVFCFFYFFLLFCSCFFLGFFVVLFFLEGLRVRWGGHLGHLTWPLNPPYFLFVFCFCFFVFLKNRKKLVFPPKKGIFVVHSSVFPFVSF